MTPLRSVHTWLMLGCLVGTADVRGDDFPVEGGRPTSPAPAGDEPLPEKPADEPPTEEPTRRRPRMLQAEPGEDVPAPPVRRRRRTRPGTGAAPLDPRDLERTLADIAQQLAQQHGGRQAGGFGFGFGTRMRSSSTTTRADGTTVRTLSESDGTTTVALEAADGDVTVTITGKGGKPIFDGTVADPAAPDEVPPRFRGRVRELAGQLGVGGDPVDR